MFTGFVHIETGELAFLKDHKTREKRQMKPGQRLDLLVAEGVWIEGTYAPGFSPRADHVVDDHLWMSKTYDGAFCALTEGMKMRTGEEEK